MTTCIIRFADGTEEKATMSWGQWQEMWRTLLWNGKRVRAVTVDRKTVEFS